MEHNIWLVTLLSSMAMFAINSRVEGAKPLVPCFFIFGDSLSDSGNNNDLVSFAKANFRPYGIDFPAGPTGRFTNGRTTVDLIGEELGLEGYIKPYPQSRDPVQAMKGVNYASGSAGILHDTGAIMGDRVRFDLQLENHQKTIVNIQTILGRNTTAHLQKCLYSVWVGSNDWMLNYFGSPLAKPNKKYSKLTPEQFTDNLITRFTDQLDKMYQLGARKVVLFGLHPLGCAPTAQLFGRCSDYINNALQNYNKRLRKVQAEFTNKYKDLKISFINSFDIFGRDYSGTGMKVRSIPCCGALTLACLPITIPCFDRTVHAHWDNAHPTEAVNHLLASRAFRAKYPTDAYPMDISQLVAL